MNADQRLSAFIRGSKTEFVKKLRKIIFWCHLPVGVIAGLVIFTMCVTGVLLSFEKQITAWADTQGFSSEPPTAETTHLPVETSISSQLPTSATAPLTFNIDSGNGGQPQKRAQLVLDRATGNVWWESLGKRSQDSSRSAARSSSSLG